MTDAGPTLYHGLAALPFVVVRISGLNSAGKVEVGTGFFYEFDLGGRFMKAVVSNKHVFLGQDFRGLRSINLTLPRAGPDGRRALGPGFDVSIGGLDVFCHPDPAVDLAVVPIQPFYEAALRDGVAVSAVYMSQSLIVPSEEESELPAATSVLMVGFPNGLMDEHNSLPLVRRGTLSTPYAADYKGTPNFVVDIAAFGGSSGSPVFSYFDSVRTRSDGEVVAGSALHLIGVLHSGPQLDVEGRVVDRPAPTDTTSITRMMINLGYCAKAKLLRGFLPGLRTLGAPKLNIPPMSYL